MSDARFASFPCRVRCISKPLGFEGAFKIGEEFTALGVEQCCGSEFLRLQSNGAWYPENFEPLPTPPEGAHE